MWEGAGKPLVPNKKCSILELGVRCLVRATLAGAIKP